MTTTTTPEQADTIPAEAVEVAADAIWLNLCGDIRQTEIDKIAYRDAARAALEAAGEVARRAAVPSEQEPVAWRWRWKDQLETDGWCLSEVDPRPGSTPTRMERFDEVQPLYAHPAPAAGVKVLRDALQAVVDEVRNVASASYIREPVLSQVIAALEDVAPMTLDPNGLKALVQAAEDRNVPLMDAKAIVRAYLVAASPSPPALDGAGRDAVLEEIAKWLEEQAEADFTMAEDMPEYSPEGYRLMLRRKWRKADAAAIRALKETR